MLCYQFYYWLYLILVHFVLLSITYLKSRISLNTPCTSVTITMDFPLEGPRSVPFANQDISDLHDDVIKWRHFPRYWPFVRGIHRGPVNSPHKGQWRGALMFTLICTRIIGWVNNRETGDLRRYRTHYDVTVMFLGYRLILCLNQLLLESHNCSGSLDLK